MKKIISVIIMLSGIYITKAQTTVSEKDKKFAICVAEDGLIEVKLGELAQANGSSAEVKELGNHMINDHSKANSELRSLAATKGIALPTTLNKKGQKAYDKLSKKQGKDFDKAYTKCMVKDHKKDICEFKREAKKGSDPELKAWAINTIPTLEQHKQMAENTCKIVNK